MTLCGNLDRQGVASAMVASDVFVLASYLEAWALVVNEACLFSLPLILSDQVGAGADLLVPGENGFVFAVGDVNALAGYVEELAGDAAKRKAMGSRSSQILGNWRSQYPAVDGYGSALLHALSGQGQCNP